MALDLLKRRNRPGEEEMSFVDHLEELRWHIVRSVIAVVILGIVCFVYQDFLFDRVILAPIQNNFITYKLFCELGQKLGMGNSLCMPAMSISMQTTTFGGQFLSSITICFVMGFIVAFPYVFWEFWKFLKPALKPGELKNTRGAIFWVTFFFILGVGFGYYLMAPFTFNFLANYKIGTHNIIETRPTISDYIDNMMDITLGSGLAFELPVISFVLTRIGLITPKFLKDYRKYAYVALLVIAAVITPSPDWMSQTIVVIPLIILYELSIVVSKRVAKDQKQKDKEEWS
ncbi:MAG: twin-arginine translocase subunit TatC [Chitinophagaceae bacterium]